MEINFSCFLSLVILLSSSHCLADDAVIQLQLRRPINLISDKFISFSVDPSELLDILKNTGYALVGLSGSDCFLYIFFFQFPI